MIIEKYICFDGDFYHYYGSKTNIRMPHGLWYDYGIGYNYHQENKGFWLMTKEYL